MPTISPKLQAWDLNSVICVRVSGERKTMSSGPADKPLNELDDDGLKTLAKDLMLFIQKTKLPRYESIIPDHFEQNYKKCMVSKYNMDEWEEDIEGD